VRLVDFLILLLETQGQTLQRLAAFFGEDFLFEMLEVAGEATDLDPPIQIDTSDLIPPRKPMKASVYGELEIAVRDLKLPAVLEFHLWAYPFYRAVIESSSDLNSHIQGERLIEQALAQSKAWFKKLPIPPEFTPQAERVASFPWLRFRANVLRKIGKRPVNSI
jgi:hypothetical protein